MDVQEKLHKEASEILSNDHWLKNYTKLSELPYTEAVINEAIRLKPVAPILIFEPTEDIEIDNYLFAKGCKIFTQFRLGSTSDAYFSNGKTFMPERWLKDSSVSKCPVHNIDAYTPFGSGPRFCPGKNLAMLEMKMILTMLMKNFTVEMITPMNEINEIMAFTMTPSQFKIRLKKR
jgi:cytochrome P450